MPKTEFTIKVRLEIVPHTPGDDTVHAEECAHVRTHFPGTRFEPGDDWLCIAWCPLRRSLECVGAVYRTADEAERDLYARLREGEPE